MAKYIKQEMNDLSGKGEKKVYYRLQTERNIGFDELAREIESRHGMMNRGLVKSVMAYVVDAMAGFRRHCWFSGLLPFVCKD